MADKVVLRQGLHVLGVAIREEPRIFAASVAASALYGVMTVGSALALGWVTDEVILPAFREDRTTAGALTAAFTAVFGVALLKALGVVGRRLWAGMMQYRLQATYRRRVTRQYLRLPLAWHHRHPTGSLLSNANADVEAAWYPIAPLPMATGVLVMLLVAAISMLVTDWALALVGFVVFPAIFALNVVYQRRQGPLAMRAQELRADVSEIAHESFDGALVVKTLGRETEETARFAAASRKLADANIAVGRVRALFDPLLEALPSFGVLLVLVVGATRVADGGLAAGDLVQVAYLFTLLAFPVRAIGWLLGDLPRAVVGYDRVRAVLDAEGEHSYGTAGRPEAAAGSARLAVRGVRFGYADGPDVLREVTFDVEPGRTVAVVGPTGSGKSTLVSLLVRLVDPVDGGILLDGVDLREYRRGGIAATAALVPQQAFLFDDTVRDNITLGLDVDDAAVREALRVARAEEFVDRLPRGLDTPVGERGTTLSGGQRQRIALARALVRRPRLLVLDDATSAVDPRVEAEILHGLRDAGPATVVVVAYRKATIALADEVVYVQDGAVAARGPHDELLERSAGYRELVNAYERAAREAAEDTDPANGGEGTGGGGADGPGGTRTMGTSGRPDGADGNGRGTPAQTADGTTGRDGAEEVTAS